ncbi:MAG: pyruvate synthase subunit beta [Elusimicrobia bacterium]|nr:pyruvate synthase subunit beta [Elusimicrobiota bacterium]
MIREIFGKNCIFVVPAGCYTIIDGAWPYSSSGVPFLHCAFETAAATASGIKAGLNALGQNDTQVVAIAGDGGTFDIGFQALSAAAERNEDIFYFCYDNEAYMNTGIQRSSATPLYAATTTTPAQTPKLQPKKDMGFVMAGHRVPYFATATLAFHEDLKEKIKKAKEIKGFRMIHYFSSCPTGWKADSRHMVALTRLAVESRVFPLYEIFHGERWVINQNPPQTPVEKYFELQGRYKHLSPEQKAVIQKEADKNWQRLTKLAAGFN